MIPVEGGVDEREREKGERTVMISQGHSLECF